MERRVPSTSSPSRRIDISNHEYVESYVPNYQLRQEVIKELEADRKELDWLLLPMTSLGLSTGSQ
jgi:hypothetical protein